MGNACGKEQKFYLDYNKCKNISDIKKLLIYNIERIQNKVKDALAESNYYNGAPTDSQQNKNKFYYLMKLEIVLVKIKMIIEDKLTPLHVEQEILYNINKMNNKKKNSRKSSNIVMQGIKKSCIGNIETGDICNDQVDAVPNALDKFDRNQIESIKLFLLEIFETEEEFDEDCLSSLEKTIYQRVNHCQIVQ